MTNIQALQRASRALNRQQRAEVEAQGNVGRVSKPQASPSSAVICHPSPSSAEQGPMSYVRWRMQLNGRSDHMHIIMVSVLCLFVAYKLPCRARGPQSLPGLPPRFRQLHQQHGPGVGDAVYWTAYSKSYSHGEMCRTQVLKLLAEDLGCDFEEVSPFLSRIPRQSVSTIHWDHNDPEGMGAHYCAPGAEGYLVSAVLRHCNMAGPLSVHRKHQATESSGADANKWWTGLFQMDWVNDIMIRVQNFLDRLTWLACIFAIAFVTYLLSPVVSTVCKIFDRLLPAKKLGERASARTSSSSQCNGKCRRKNCVCDDHPEGMSSELVKIQARVAEYNHSKQVLFDTFIYRVCPAWVARSVCDTWGWVKGDKPLILGGACLFAVYFLFEEIEHNNIASMYRHESAWARSWFLSCLWNIPMSEAVFRVLYEMLSVWDVQQQGFEVFFHVLFIAAGHLVSHLVFKSFMYDTLCADALADQTSLIAVFWLQIMVPFYGRGMGH